MSFTRQEVRIQLSARTMASSRRAWTITFVRRSECVHVAATSFFQHTLAIRILALWLESRSIFAPVIIEDSDLERLARSIVEAAPVALLISMALPEQFNAVSAISALVGRLPSGVRPRVLVGGYAVKSGLVRFVPGADLVADISLLSVA